MMKTENKINLKNILQGFFLLLISFQVCAQADSSHSELSFDFGITRGRNINLWPILKRYKSSDKSELQIAYPIFSKSTIYNPTQEHFQFLPFAINDSNADVINRRYISIYYPSVFHYQNRNNDHYKTYKFLELAPSLSCVGVSKSTDGLFVDNNLFFFIWYKRNNLLGKTRFVVFPAYWHYSNNMDTTNLLFPIFYNRKSKEQNNLNIALLYNQKKTEFQIKKVFFPLIWKSLEYQNTDTIKKNVLFPLYWSKRSKDESNKSIFPLLYSYKNKFYYSFTFLPFFSYGHDSNSIKNHLYIVPNYWHSISNEKSTNIVFPLWWNYKKYSPYDTIKEQILFPFLWSVKSKEKDNKTIFPLVYNYKNNKYKSFTFLPIYSHGESIDLKNSYTGITPLYWHLKNKNITKKILLPLYWNTNEYLTNDTIKKNTLFPIYWSTKSLTRNNTILFPIIYSHRNTFYNSFTFFPIYSQGQSKEPYKNYVAVTPFFWHTRNWNVSRKILFPIYWESERKLKDDTLYKTTIFPIYWSTKSRYKNNRVLFPILVSLRDSSYKSLTLLPLFSIGKSLDLSRRHFDIFPIYWHFQTKYSLNNIIFPIWWNFINYSDQDTIVNKFFVPLFWSYKNRERNNKIVFPFVYSIKNNNYKSFTFLPLYSQGESNDLKNKYTAITPLYWRFQNPNSTKNIFLPLFWNSSEYRFNDTLNKNILFPVYWSIKSKNKNNKTIFPLIYSYKNNLYKSFTIFPLYSHSKSLRSNIHYTAITPLFWHLQSENKIKNILLPIYWNGTEYLKNDTIKKNTFLPFYWSYKSKNENNKTLFPLLFSYKSNHNRSFTFFPLYLSSKSYEKDNKYLAITPIFWHTKSNDVTRNILFPIYWSTKSEYENNKVLFPLIYHFKNKNYQSFTFFPLFSHSKSIDTKHTHTAITQFYWHIKNDSITKNILLPIFWSRTQILKYDTIKKHTLFPIYWSTKSNNESNKILFPLLFSFKDSNHQSFTLFPLLSMGHSTDDTKKYFMLTPLSGYFKSPDKTNAYLFPIFDVSKSKQETKSSFLLFLYNKTKRQNYAEVSVLWPICKKVKFDNYRYLRIAPIVWYEKTDSSSIFSIQPINYCYKSNTKKTYILGWFLYKYENIMGISTANNILWKTYTTEKFTNGDFETRFLHLIYANIKKNGEREISILPIYHKINYKNGDMLKSVFFGFYNHFKQYIPEIKESYEEERFFWFLRLRSNYEKLKGEGKAKYLRRK